MARAQGASYEVKVPCASDPSAGLAAFAAAAEVPYTKPYKKGKGKPKTIDVKFYIPQVESRWQDGMLDLSFDVRITPTGSMKLRNSSRCWPGISRCPWPPSRRTSAGWTCTAGMKPAGKSR